MEKDRQRTGSFSMVLGFSLLLVTSGCGPTHREKLDVEPASVNGLSLLPASYELEANAEYLVGSGLGDITGPASGLATAGYAAPAPKTAGIHQRLWARGLIMAERGAEERRVVLVTTDLCYVTGIVKDAVVKKLAQRFGDFYRHDNVLIAATHTHSGPAGFSQHGMYNTPSGGFSQENFDIIVSGIVTAIVQADASLQPGSVDLIAGSLRGASRNRSMEAYIRNASVLKSELPDAVDESVTLLKLTDENGPVAIQHWFATHGTSMDKRNALISGDNKGYAAWRFEKMMRDESGVAGFVAAFANSNAGDASPNIAGDVDNDGDWECADNDNFACMRLIGEKQFASARELFAAPSTAVGKGIRSVLQFVDMSQVTLNPSETGLSENVTTCDPAIGVSMLAGSEEDGPGVGREGVSCDNGGPLVRQRCRTERLSCHGNKPVVIPTEDVGRYGFTPHIVPVQLITIGKLAIAGVPAEMTSMAGHLLKKSLGAKLASQGIERVVIAAYANEYSNYVTTRDEYQAQNYEGASTLFGEWTLAAYQKKFSELADEISQLSGMSLGSMPPYATEGLRTAKQRRGLDRVPRGTEFGAGLTAVRSTYKSGDTVKMSFQASNLNNDMRTGSSFFTVEKKDGDRWRTVSGDNDFFTRLHWYETRGAQSQVTIEWDVRSETERGLYRIVFTGRAVDLFGRGLDYQGLSSTFVVQ